MVSLLILMIGQPLQISVKRSKKNYFYIQQLEHEYLQMEFKRECKERKQYN